MMRSWLATLALAATVFWSRPGHCVDDAQREKAVAATVERDAKKAAVDAATDALKKETSELKDSFTKAEATVKTAEDSLPLIDASKVAQPTKDAINKATNELKGRVLPELKDGQAAEDRNAAAKSYLGSVENAHKALKDAGEDLKKGGASADSAVSGLEAAKQQIADLVSRVAELEKLDADVVAATTAWKEADDAAKKALATYVEDTKPAGFLSERLSGARKLRCLTAYCFGGEGGSKYAIEPVLDLPVGLVWATGGGALPSYINSHTVNVEFNAGLRFWFGYDIMSVMVYFSRPLIVGDDPIHVSGSTYAFPPSAVHRPFPSVGIGLAGDVLLLGVSYDELRNGSTDATRDLTYPANYVLSRSITFSLGFSLFNTAKNAVGGASESKKSESTP